MNEQECEVGGIQAYKGLLKNGKRFGHRGGEQEDETTTGNVVVGFDTVKALEEERLRSHPGPR